MLAGIIIGAALVVAAIMLFGIGSSTLVRERQLLGFSITGLAIAAAVIAVVLQTSGSEPGFAEAELGSGMSVAELARASSSLRSSVSTSSSQPTATSRVASVPSLIDGLERRLESDPDNASGWALLAQSYAFTGDAAGAELALQRAVALGVDESDLRQRVDSARREPHAGLAGPATAAPSR